MKLIYAIVFLIVCSTTVSAKDRGVSLNDAVNQAKSQGKVLSARTINGQHEVKVLRPNGSVKTINKKANRKSNFANNGSSTFGGANTWHNQLKNEAMPSRNQSKSRNVMRLKDRNSRSSQSGNYNNRSQINNSRNVQGIPNRSKAASTRSKDKDN